MLGFDLFGKYGIVQLPLKNPNISISNIWNGFVLNLKLLFDIYWIEIIYYNNIFELIKIFFTIFLLINLILLNDILIAIPVLILLIYLNREIILILLSTNLIWSTNELNNLNIEYYIKNNKIFIKVLYNNKFQFFIVNSRILPNLLKPIFLEIIQNNKLLNNTRKVKFIKENVILSLTEESMLIPTTTINNDKLY